MFTRRFGSDGRQGKESTSSPRLQYPQIGGTSMAFLLD